MNHESSPKNTLQFKLFNIDFHLKLALKLMAGELLKINKIHQSQVIHAAAFMCVHAICTCQLNGVCIDGWYGYEYGYINCA